MKTFGQRNIDLNAIGNMPDLAGPIYVHDPRTGTQVCQLSVSDVAKLATAGVKMDFDQIKAQVTPDLPPPERPGHDGFGRRTMEVGFWERWRRGTNYREGEIPAFDVTAHECDGKVYAFIQPNNKPPFVLEDDARLWPSDALMAKLHLWGQVKP